MFDNLFLVFSVCIVCVVVGLSYYGPMLKNNKNKNDSWSYNAEYDGLKDENLPPLNDNTISFHIEAILKAIYDSKNGNSFFTLEDNKSDLFVQTTLSFDDPKEPKFMIQYRPSVEEKLYQKIKLCDLQETINFFTSVLKYREDFYVPEEWEDTGFFN